MIRPKNLNFLLLFTAVVIYSLSPRICRAQGNGTSGNPCETYGKCGPFGVCNSQDSPICSCLRGFYPRNNQEWDKGNWTSGCVRRVALNCESGNNGATYGAKEDGFLKLQMMKIKTSGSDRWFGPENQCDGRCLRNCSCLAYGFDVGVGSCMFWSEILIDIQKFPSGSGSDLYIRLSSSELDEKKDPKKIIIIVVVVGFVAISICTYFSWKWIAKYRGNIYANNPLDFSKYVQVSLSYAFHRELGKRKAIGLAKARTSGSVDSSLQDALSQVNLEELPFFKFEIVANATNSFSEANKLGKGGFGSVYKGELVNGREIAVKRLSQASRQGMQEFMNEVVLISKLQHRNLVRLLGCCVDNKETMLIYEYMPNKSLDFFLFDQSQEVLDWRKRFNIIQGICRGLLYLHRDSRLKIIHRDLKPSNILLDNDWNPKISDFGMARIYGTKLDHVSTVKVVGTYGYMAPEYAMEGRFSEKSDVFSFGVLMLEIAIGKRNTSFHYQDGSLNLLGHVWKLWNEDNVAALIDPRISSSGYQAEVMRCMQIGLLCVQELPKDRPSISAVLSMLSSEIIELPEPKKPAFALKSSCSDTVPSSSQQSKSTSSLNSVTLSVVDGR